MEIYITHEVTMYRACLLCWVYYYLFNDMIMFLFIIFLPLKFCGTFHGGHRLQKVAFQLEIHNTIPPGSTGQPKTKYRLIK